MKKEDKKEFMRLMDKLRIRLPTRTRLRNEKEIAIFYEGYWEAMELYAIETIRMSFEEATTTLKWFPVITEFLDICDSVADERQRKAESEYNPNQLELRPMTKEEAIKAILGVQDHLDRPGMNEEEIAKDKEKVAERKAFLKAQAAMLKLGETPKGKA